MKIKPISYTEFALFNSSQSQYYKRYIKGEIELIGKEAQLGLIIHKAIENKKYDWLYMLKQDSELYQKRFVVRKLLDKMETKRPQEGEKVLIGKLKDGLEEIKLMGIFDGFSKYKFKNKFNYVLLDEYKTTEYEKVWNQYTVDRFKQLTFYALVYYLVTRSFLNEIRLHWLNTLKANIKTFKTARGPKDIWALTDEILDMVRKLKDKGWWNLRLSAEDRAKQELPLNK